MTGFLNPKGIRASEKRVGAALQAVHPQHHEARQQVSLFAGESLLVVYTVRFIKLLFFFFL